MFMLYTRYITRDFVVARARANLTLLRICFPTWFKYIMSGQKTSCRSNSGLTTKAIFLYSPSLAPLHTNNCRLVCLFICHNQIASLLIHIVTLRLTSRRGGATRIHLASTIYLFFPVYYCYDDDLLLRHF